MRQLDIAQFIVNTMLLLSQETLSNITKTVSEEIQAWQNRPLDSCCPFVYIDCLYAKVKQDFRSTKRCIVHIDRNIYNILPKSMVKEVMADFKLIYTANNLSYAKGAYRNFSEKYGERYLKHC